MNVVDIHQTVKLTLAVVEHEYNGEKDSCQFRNGNGHQIWQKEQWRQQYTGNFLQDCLHNYGTYTWRNIDSRYQHTYEGKYFGNNLEGYGTLSYPDGKIYEGLFKANKRYGPGVLTHPDGSQDVGLWEGNNLVRLNQNLPNKPVPVLAQSVQGKAYLLNYKDLIRVQNKVESMACKILSSADDSSLKKCDILCSKFVKNSNSTFFNKKLYYDNYFDNESDWTINVVHDNDGDPITIQLLVSHLLAWNNENLAISFMKHAFMHRNYETILTYNVSDVLTGNRIIFKDPGSQETNCLKLLESCCQDDESIIAKLICHYDLYPDVSDFQGNNGIIYAATYDQEHVIKVLTNFGANVDHMNDECLTALSMSILKYTAYKYDVKTWELAFIPPSGDNAHYPGIIQQWRTNDIITDISIGENEIYRFDLSCVHPVLKKGKSKKDKRDTKSKDDKKKKKGAKNNEPIEPEKLVDLKAEYLEKVLGTIICLLQCGAKPNYGKCPFPPLILSVFARSVDIVNQLIIFGADTNIRTSFKLGSLTPLLVLASLSPSIELISMAYILLYNGANPNKRANITHWEDEFRVILAGTEADDYYNGKTPLHLLCMRYDFIDDKDDYLGELCTVFINSGADPNMVYLCHIPLTLAMIRGNIKMMQRILDSGLVDPNQGLGNNMGVPLTVLILKRYENILPLDVCEQIFNCLLHYYANPLNVVPGFEGNAIEFTLKENIAMEITKDAKTPKSGKSGKSGRSTKSEKSGKSNKSKGGKLKGNEQVIQLLYDAAEIILVKRIQRKVVQMLYQYKIECCFDDPIFEQIVKYIDVDTTLHYLQILLDYDKIVPSKTFCYFLLEFVNSKIKKKPDKHKKGKKFGPSPEDLVEELDYTQTTIRAKQFSFKLFMPEMDPDESKFKVCFECLQRTNKILILCPKCQLVYFCSQECNIRNMKKKTTKHPCNFLFYNNELNQMQKRMEAGLPMYKSNKFDHFNTLRQRHIARTPNYFEKIKIYDKIMTDNRIAETEERERDAINKKKDKGKRKNSRRRSGSLDDEGDNKRGRRKSRESKGGKGRHASASRDEGVSKRKKERNSVIQDKAGSLDDEGGNKRGRRKSKEPKGGKGRHASASNDEGVSKKKKERNSVIQDKAEKTTKKATKEKSLTRKSIKDNSLTRTAKKDKTTDSLHGHPKQHGTSSDESPEESGKTKDLADKTTSVSPDGQPKPSDLSPDRTSRSISRDVTGKTIEGQQTNASPDGRPSQLNRDISPDKYDGIEGHGDVQDRDKFATDEFRDAISDICEKFDCKFFQMFMPYCVFVNGQLYYKFDNVNTFYKLTYSNV